jgi:DNA-binding transcriptional LysR family regulator
VRDGLRLLEQALRPRVFEPATATRTFVLSASDYVEFVLLPRLLARIGRDAPGVRVQVLPWGLHQVPDELARGAADLMIGFYDKLPAHHREQLLFEERYACLVRKGHPQVAGKLTLRTYVGLKHVMVTQRAGATSGIDRALARLGHSREVSLRVSHFLNVPPLVASTDLVAALSRRVAEPFARLLPLRLFDPPLRLRVSRVGMVWHDAVQDDPGHRWLREVVAGVCARL